MTLPNQPGCPSIVHAEDWPYAIARKPLMKWASQRVSIQQISDQSIQATFRYDGSTCTNQGLPLAAEFVVELNLEPTGDWRINNASCTPAVGDIGCAATCAALSSPHSFLESIAQFSPLMDKTLSDAVTWAPSIEYSGCFCTAGNQNHKWRNAIQSIHLAVAQWCSLQESKDETENC